MLSAQQKSMASSCIHVVTDDGSGRVDAKGSGVERARNINWCEYIALAQRIAMDTGRIPVDTDDVSRCVDANGCGDESARKINGAKDALFA